MWVVVVGKQESVAVLFIYWKSCLIRDCPWDPELSPQSHSEMSDNGSPRIRALGVGPPLPTLLGHLHNPPPSLSLPT